MFFNLSKISPLQGGGMARIYIPVLYRKRYDRAESEFVASKMALHSCLERKEMLTDHLCTIIEQVQGFVSLKELYTTGTGVCYLKGTLHNRYRGLLA